MNARCLIQRTNPIFHDETSFATSTSYIDLTEEGRTRITRYGHILNILMQEKWYTTNHHQAYTELWDFTINNDYRNSGNKVAVIIKDFESYELSHNYGLDKDISAKEFKQFSSYKNLGIEI